MTRFRLFAGISLLSLLLPSEFPPISPASFAAEKRPAPAAGPTGARKRVSIEKIDYKGWPNSYRISNGKLELVATTDVGPRIIRLAVPDGPNEFKEFDEMIGKTGGSEWRIYGGHRFWHAPEVRPRTYAPDNERVDAKIEGDTLRLTQPVETSTGIQKEVEIRLSPDAPRARVTHRLTNRGSWPVELAPWALSVMAPGGAAFLPHPAKPADADRLLPNRTLALWPYSDMADPRHVWGKEFFVVKSRDAQGPTKIGVSASDGWAAYSHNGRLFVKRFHYMPGERYPDLGSAVEIYTATGMLELETLGPLRTLQPGGTVEHVEEWFLIDGPEVTDEASARKAAEVIRRETEAVRL